MLPLVRQVVLIKERTLKPRRSFGKCYIGISGDYDGMEYPIPGLADVSRFPNLLIELASRGWTEKELRKVTGENFLRVFGDIEKSARELKKSAKKGNLSSGQNRER